MPDFEEMGKAFTGFYYQAFSNDRASLANVYTEQSCLTFEGAQFQGKGPIIAKLQSLPFKTVNHQLTTVDCQPIIGVDDNQVLLSFNFGTIHESLFLVIYDLSCIFFSKECDFDLVVNLYNYQKMKIVEVV